MTRQSITSSAGMGAAILAGITLAALLAQVISPSAPETQQLIQRLDPPSWAGGEHGRLLGTDHLGRDVLSRVIHGARVSLAIGIAGVVLSGSIGVSLGLVAGYYGGHWDRVIMRIADLQQAIPGLVLAIAVVAVVRPSLISLIVVLALTTWITFARLIRSEVLALRESLFVIAARMVGARDRRIIARHILPNVAPSIIVMGSITGASVILIEASLSFLGLGVPPPTPTWGRMVFDGLDYVSTAWWIPVFPAAAVMLTVLGSNLVGDGLRDLLDPRLPRR